MKENNAFDMYRSRRKILIGLTVLCIVIFLYCYFNSLQYSWYVRSGNTHCKTPEKEMDELKALFRDTHKILEKFELTNFLVYGSLWGALRINNPLPWDNDFDIGIIQKEVEAIDEKKLFREFNALNIHIYYRLWLGSYRVERGNARGDIMVYAPTFYDYYRRSGIERFIIFVHHLKHHIFPSRLIQLPLPRTEFAGLKVSVPREGIEIQKYFYRNDWWKESKPKGC